MLKFVLVSAAVLTYSLSPLYARPNEELVLADHGSAQYQIAISESASDVEQFAAQQLQAYLKRMTGADFTISHGQANGNTILLGSNLVPAERVDKSRLGFDGFRIDAREGSILLAGANDRGTLFGVYAFLESLGCRWFAPNFAFYGPSGGEVVPRSERLVYSVSDRVITPSMKYRKEDVEEGDSHTLQSLRQIIEWMPKVGMNVFECPLDYEGLGHTVWDNWRTDLIPELKKRGILIEIGGHGYQNFLPQKVYFGQHPEWFGMRDGKPTDDGRMVFETSNPHAMEEFLANIEKYLRAHPEIDIFDLWPPDSARWSESPESLRLGDPTRRHALVVSAAAQMVKEKFPSVRVEFLSYDNYLYPPRGVKFPDNTVLDFCPIDRSFQLPLWGGSDFNWRYVVSLGLWLRREAFKGDLSIYTYYRKYAWRSLPIVIPRLIAAEARHYQERGVNGMSIYSEPADWFTFELNNYVFARATFDSHLDIDSLLADYAQERFGPSSAPIREYFDIIEKTTPSTCTIPGTVVGSEVELEVGLRNLAHAGELLKQANQLARENDNLKRLIGDLQASLDYATLDLQIRRLTWRIAHGPTFRDETAQLPSLLTARRQLLSANKDHGIFLS